MSNKVYPCLAKKSQGEAFRILRNREVIIKWACIGEAPICDGCGGRIEAKSHIVEEEWQTSWFRGDDEIKIYHAKCYNKLRRKQKGKPE